MDVVIGIIIGALGGWALVVGVAIFIFLNPEKVEKWAALFWLLLSRLGSLFRSAHKQYVRHDLQGRINEFVKRVGNAAPYLATRRIRIEWTDATVTRRGFIQDGSVILRLRRDDPQHINFVHGAYLYVSTGLLHKAKRYITPTQREAMDLFVCTKVLEAERHDVVGVFLDDYLHPKTEEPASKVAVYVDDFSVIDTGNLFFSVFLQELEYLGEKVFGRRRDHVIGVEVDGLIDFLKPIATRAVGDTSDLNFDGAYCRFGMVIVGKPRKLLYSIEPYVSYIRNVLVMRDVETIYILSRAENRDRVDEICRPFSDRYTCVRRHEFKRVLKYSDKTEMAKQYLAVLRKQGVSIIQPSESG